MNNRTKSFFKWVWILPLLIWFVLTIAGMTETNITTELDKPDYVDPIFEINAYDAIWSQPKALIEIKNTDVSEMIVDDRLKLIVNGEIYWIRLEKD